VNEVLQQGFEAPWRQFEPRRQSLRGNRGWARMDRDIDDSGKRELAAAGEENH